MAIINKTSICYNNTAVIIGNDSNYEISYEKKDYEGVDKIEKIEDIPTVKIVFHQLTLTLLNWLKASEKQTAGIKFWNATGEANGIYQAHFTCDEFKQTVTLFLYQKRSEAKTANYTADLLDTGITLIHPFGRGNFKVGGVTVPIVRSLAEKNISTDIQKYKFADGWQYFITDKTTFNIKIFDLTTGSSPLINQLEAIKNQMVKFIPHAENPAVEYKNAYLDFEKKEVDGRFTVEVSLQLVSEINNLNFVYPPIINRIGRITLSAMATSQICYTYSATGTPAQPTPDNWILYTPETDLAFGNYMIVAVENGVMSAVISEEIREQETVTISDPVKPLKPAISIENKLIVIEAESGAEIFYTENQYGLSQTPNQKNWTRYIDPLPAKSSNYKAIARKNYKNSDVAELTRSEIDSYLISTAKNEAVTAAVYTAASLAAAAKSEAISAAETKLSEMVGASPETLNTLNELATALGNDPNFAATTATEIGKRIKTEDAISAIGTAKSEAANDATNKANAAKAAAEATAATLAGTAKNEAISAAQAGLDNLQIGGRNIAVNSKLPAFYSCDTNLGDSTTIIENGITFRRAVAVKTDSTGNNPNGKVEIFHATTLDYLKPNDDITLSIMVKQDSGRLIHVGLYAENQNAWGGNDSVQSGVWTKISATGKKLTNGLFAIILKTTDYNIIDYRNLKLEFGSKATDWTPAPEDITAEISTAKSETLTTAAADATTKANAAKLAAEATAANALNNLKIGGRNLCKNSSSIFLSGSDTPAKVIREIGKISVIENGAWNAYFHITNMLVKTTTELLSVPNPIYTFSIDIKRTNTNNTNGFYFVGGFRSPTEDTATTLIPLEDDKWHRVSCTVMPTILNNIYSIIYIRCNNDSLGSIIEYKNLKVEIGNKATDWTPAPEDITAEISTAKSEAITAANETTAAVAARVDEVEQTTMENSESISNTYQKVIGLEKSVVFSQNKIVFGNQDWIEYIVNSAKTNFYYSADYYGVLVKGEQTFCINAIMAIEPGSSYKVSVRARSLDGNTTIYAGVDTLNANKLTISTDQATPYNYGTANGAAVSGDSVTYTGYFSGYNAPTEVNKNKFDGGGCFFRVALCCNKGQATTFRTLIESVEIEKISVSRAVDIIQDDNRNFVSLAERNQISDTYNRLVALEEQSLMHMSMLECISQKLVDAHIGSGTCIETKG